MIVAKDEIGALALDDQGIERREDMDQIGRDRLTARLEHGRRRPMLLLAGAVERDRHELAAADAGSDQAGHRLLARGVEVADRIEAHHTLRPQRAVDQIGGDLPCRGRPWQRVPAEMARHQLVGLEHALPLADGDGAGIEGQLQRPLGGLAALPQMLLLDEHVILDVADRQRTGPQQPHHLAHVGGLHRGEPFVPLAPMLAHRRQEETEVAGRHVGERVGPILEHASVGALGMAQIGAAIGRDPAEQNVMMAALDDVDGVDLHIAEMSDRIRDGLCSLAERGPLIQPLGMQPDLPGLSRGEGMGFGCA
jgi:hypothetical protein